MLEDLIEKNVFYGWLTNLKDSIMKHFRLDLQVWFETSHCLRCRSLNVVLLLLLVVLFQYLTEKSIREGLFSSFFIKICAVSRSTINLIIMKKLLFIYMFINLLIAFDEISPTSSPTSISKWDPEPTLSGDEPHNLHSFSAVFVFFCIFKWAI